jgi:ribonuclease E
MLINGQRTEELRVAIVNNGVLENYQVEAAESGLCRGNIYLGIVTSIQPSLNAAFVDFGAERQGFLSADDVVPQSHRPGAPRNVRFPRIEQVLERGQRILIQVVKDSVGTKGAVITTSITLAGRYLVLMPFDNTRGISRKADDEERRQIQERLSGLVIPDGFGCIVRTNAINQTKLTLQRDLSALSRLWRRIQEEFSRAQRARSPRQIYSDQDLIVQALRDYLDASIEEVIIDNEQLLEKAQSYVSACMPRSRIQLLHYTDRMPLFSRFGLEDQIESIYRREVRLPSGGYIVIDGTEALTAIDVNSGRSTKANTHEETAFKTNTEAADEVARQLRLRDIGGLIVVDFIDMRLHKHRRVVEKNLRDAVKDDKARIKVAAISENGLLEINRQRIKQALQLRTHRLCPTCGGGGRIASPEMIGLSLLRRIEERAVTGTLDRVTIGLHPEVANAIQNLRRNDLFALEDEFGIRIEVNAVSHLHRSEEELSWHRRDGAEPPPTRPATDARAFTRPYTAASLVADTDPDSPDLADDPSLDAAHDDPSHDAPSHDDPSHDPSLDAASDRAGTFDSGDSLDAEADADRRWHPSADRRHVEYSERHDDDSTHTLDGFIVPDDLADDLLAPPTSQAPSSQGDGDDDDDDDSPAPPPLTLPAGDARNDRRGNRRGGRRNSRRSSSPSPSSPSQPIHTSSPNPPRPYRPAPTPSPAPSPAATAPAAPSPAATAAPSAPSAPAATASDSAPTDDNKGSRNRRGRGRGRSSAAPKGDAPKEAARNDRSGRNAPKAPSTPPANSRPASAPAANATSSDGDSDGDSDGRGRSRRSSRRRRYRGPGGSDAAE